MGARLSSSSTPGDYPWEIETALGTGERTADHIDNVTTYGAFDRARGEVKRMIARSVCGSTLDQCAIAHVEVEFRKELFNKAIPFQMYAAILRVGVTSFTVELAIFDQHVVAAICRTVLVLTHDGFPASIPMRCREALLQFQLKTSEQRLRTPASI